MNTIVRNLSDTSMISYNKCVAYREANIPWLVDNVGFLKIKEITAHRGIPAAIQVPSWSFMTDAYSKLQPSEPELDWYFHDLTIGDGWKIFISGMCLQQDVIEPIKCMRTTVAIDEPLLAVQFKLACL